MSRFDDSSLIKKNKDFEQRLKAAAPVAREVARIVEDVMEGAGLPIRLEPRGYGAVSEKHYATGLKAESTPDFVAKSIKGDKDLARIDAKGKARTRSVGFINIRDAVKYIRTAAKDGLPVFVCTLVDPNCAKDGDVSKIKATTENTFFANLLEQDFENLTIRRQWDRNWTFTLSVEAIAAFPPKFSAAIGQDQSSLAEEKEKTILAFLARRRIRVALGTPDESGGET